MLLKEELPSKTLISIDSLIIYEEGVFIVPAHYTYKQRINLLKEIKKAVIPVLGEHYVLTLLEKTLTE